MSAVELSQEEATQLIDQTLDTLCLVRDTYEDETIRVYARLEQERQRAREEMKAADERQRDAGEREALLRARVLELERSIADLKSLADDARTDAHQVRAAAAKSNAKLTTQLKISQDELTVANDLSEMYKDAVQALQNEITELHSKPQHSSTNDPSSQIYNQELQSLMLEHTKLEQQLARSQSTIQDLRVTELVNETLENDKQRIKAELEAMRSVEGENVRLSSKILALERQARQWNVFTESSEYTSPQQLTRQVGELETHIASLKKMLETSQQIISIQKRAASEASALRKRVAALETQLDDASARETKLKIQLDTSKTHIKLLEDHLADKPMDQSAISALEARVEAIPVPTSKRPLTTTSAGDDDALDTLATKLLDAEQRAQDSSQQLVLVQKELEAAKASVSVPQPPAAVLELKGSPFEKKLQSTTEVLESLERENEALKKQLAGEDVRVVPLESIAALNTRLEVTKREADAKYRGLDQLLRGFRAKITQAKAAERSIFGYELELRNNSTCLVRSQYALEGIDTSMEKSLNFFEFIYDPAAKQYTDLSCTSSVKPFEDLYQFWIRERKYLPGFLAAVILQNYEKHANK